MGARQCTRVARAKKNAGRASRPASLTKERVCRCYGVDGGGVAVVAGAGMVVSVVVVDVVLLVDSVPESLLLPVAQAARDIVATTTAVAVRVRSVAFMEVL